MASAPQPSPAAPESALVAGATHPQIRAIEDDVSSLYAALSEWERLLIDIADLPRAANAYGARGTGCSTSMGRSTPFARHQAFNIRRPTDVDAASEMRE